MQTQNDTNDKQHIQIHVPDIFCQFLIRELAKARGLSVRVNDRSKKKLNLFCSPDEAKALLRDAKPAANMLYLLQLEAVAKAMMVTGKTPSQGMLEMVAQLRSELGTLAARV